MNNEAESLRGAGASDPGQRSHNEDAFLVSDADGLYVVADGVGGREAGEVAAQLACQVIGRRSADGDSLPEAIAEAHSAIRAATGDPAIPGRTGMACTAVILRFKGRDFELAWSGDSRAYFWDGRLLRLLSRDHSLLESLIDRGELSRDEVESHPQKNFIMSALGGESKAPRVDSMTREIPGPGCFLLCTDGLSDVLSPAVLCELLAQPGNAAERCRTLTDAARDAGGKDNITALLVPIDDAPVAAEMPPTHQQFDAVTGELSWPSDGNLPRTPTVRRLRSRTAVDDATVAADADQDPPSSTTSTAAGTEKPAAGSFVSRRWQLVILVLGAILAGLAIWQYLYSGVQ